MPGKPSAYEVRLRPRASTFMYGVWSRDEQRFVDHYTNVGAAQERADHLNALKPARRVARSDEAPF